MEKNLKLLYSVNMFVLLSREMHIFHNKPNSQRGGVYLDVQFYNEERERIWTKIK